MWSLSFAIFLAVALCFLDCWQAEGMIVSVSLTRGQGTSSDRVKNQGSYRFVTLMPEKDDRVRCQGIPSSTRGILITSYRTSGSPASLLEHRGICPF